MLLSELKENEVNPRSITAKSFKKLVKSIQTFPRMMELRPIIVDDKNVILGGNMRYRALKELGRKEVPDNWVLKASKLSKAEKDRFIIADNVPFGDWDYDILANDWDQSELIDWGLELFEPPNEDDFDEEEESKVTKKDKTECPNCGFEFVKE